MCLSTDLPKHSEVSHSELHLEKVYPLCGGSDQIAFLVSEADETVFSISDQIRSDSDPIMRATSGPWGRQLARFVFKQFAFAISEELGCLLLFSGLLCTLTV